MRSERRHQLATTSSALTTGRLLFGISVADPISLNLYRRHAGAAAHQQTTFVDLFRPSDFAFPPRASAGHGRSKAESKQSGNARELEKRRAPVLHQIDVEAVPSGRCIVKGNRSPAALLPDIFLSFIRHPIS